MNRNKIWEIEPGEGPLLAAAIHHGHLLRPGLEGLMAINEHDRLREEDPYTGEWTVIANRRIICQHSRFEVDLNRPRERAVYIDPEDSWGLQVWKSLPGMDIINTSLQAYDDFYSGVKEILSDMVQEHGFLVVFDIHSYNYMREGPDGRQADPEVNPEVNIGTGTMDRGLWAPLVDGFIDDLRRYDFFSRQLDVRENIKFRGGEFPRWIHKTFPGSVCCLSIEMKKFFMNEWTGVADPLVMKEIKLALQSAIPGILTVLKNMGSRW